jgi:uncharacterized protein YaaR (DUF327 family)
MDILTAHVAASAGNHIEEKKRKEKNVSRYGSQGFDSALNQAMETEELKLADNSPTATDKALEQLLDRVFVLGEELKKYHTLSKLGDYRSCVRQFLNFVLDNAYRAEEVNGYLNKRTMIQKKHSVVRIIDEKLDRLARAVLNEQQGVLSILAQVEEINGLLINFWR